MSHNRQVYLTLFLGLLLVAVMGNVAIGDFLFIPMREIPEAAPVCIERLAVPDIPLVSPITLSPEASLSTNVPKLTLSPEVLTVPTPKVTPKTPTLTPPEAGAKWTSPNITTNRHGQLTNGKYVLDDVGMQSHTTGSLAQGKSQFLYGVNAKQIVLDAAAYADKAGLWVGNKAKVVLDKPIGVHAQTGELTNVINVYRTETGFVHGTPGAP